MKKWFSSLNLSLKTAVISAAALVIVMLATMFLFFIGLMEIPLGITLGCATGIIGYVLLGLVDNNNNGKPALTIVSQIVRFILIAAALVVSGYLYYKMDIKLFNMFAVAGGYLIPVICLIVLVTKERNSNV